jgi:hypothetical protein
MRASTSCALAWIVAAAVACNASPSSDDTGASDVVAAPNGTKTTAGGAKTSATTAGDKAGSPAAPAGPTSAPAGTSGMLYGVTVDTVDNVDSIVEALKGLPKRPTTRVVFQPGLTPDDYAAALPAIHAVSDVMGTFLDSSGMARISTNAFSNRVGRYLSRFANDVSIWEVGNEINGNWLGETPDVAAKMTSAFDQVKAQGGKTSLTLFACSDSDDEHDMFNWVDANVPERMRTGLDYVLLSYYDGDCSNPREDWQEVFDRLHTLFPQARLGFGEVGAVDLGADLDDAAVATPLLEKYYRLPITTPGYIGGQFWWYFAEDMVPTDKPMYSVLKRVIGEIK